MVVPSLSWQIVCFEYKIAPPKKAFFPHLLPVASECVGEHCLHPAALLLRRLPLHKTHIYIISFLNLSLVLLCPEPVLVNLQVYKCSSKRRRRFSRTLHGTPVHFALSTLSAFAAVPESSAAVPQKQCSLRKNASCFQR